MPSYGQVSTPVTISGITNAVDFSMTSGNASQQNHWCAVLATGSVVCGGYGGYGQLGNGSYTSANWRTPVTVSGISNAVKVFTNGGAYSTSYGSSCALLVDGSVKCW